ncbi:MAG: integrase [Archaeoglobaceae archaeon]
MPGAGFEPATMRSSAVKTEIFEKEPVKTDIKPKKAIKTEISETQHKTTYGNPKFDDIDKEDFIRFWTSERKQKTTVKRAQKLYNVLKKVLNGKEINLDSIREGFHSTTNKKDYVNAVRVLLDYLKNRKVISRQEYEDILEMDFLTSIKSKIVILPQVSRTEADEEVAKVLSWIREKWNDEFTEMFYKLIVFSGIRNEHAYKLLTTFDPNYLEIRDNVARYRTEEIGTAIKRSFYAFMPADFAKKLKRFKDVLDLPAYESRINPKMWKPKKPEWQKSWVNGHNLRKWFANFLKRHGVELIYRKFFMGHSIGAVLEHYEVLEENSWKEYAKVVDKFPIEP